ncbi:apolipoprotein N-acyltransferase [Plebeiibacterium sediminum]|uniref:Apolipoprotein N-acyltransferase n=1 Tax=Plebeiibacterium sediminum TaxID=2992112 RepID=A0AAE3SFZ4_9BACT|nr:apolipoprotein N-acyltransferase [Plebeiobacterium sediminum]MCW3787607.1 apolipoprotein N-acyltransferase [Plebeiobacterium sediminum]
MGIAYNYFFWLIGWFCYSLLFGYVLKSDLKNRQIVQLIVVLVVTQGFVQYGWIVSLIKQYTNSESQLGYLIIPLISLIQGIKLLLPTIFLNYLSKKYKTKKNSAFLILIATSSFFVLIDWCFSCIFESLPWLLYNPAYIESTNLYFSQIAEIGGIWLMSFFIICLNLLLSFAFLKKSRTYFLFYSGLLLFIHLYGFVRLNLLTKKGTNNIRVALVCDNSNPTLRWKEENVNKYVHLLLNLNQKALKQHPDIIIWNEGVIPWSYQPDDDFLEEIIKQTTSNNCDYLISYFTLKNSFSYNSAYLFNSKGEVHGRYDKQILLGGLEKPIFDYQPLQFSFFSGSSNSNVIEGNSVLPIRSENCGLFGTMICNESLVDRIANKLAINKIGFFTLLANDNWFTNTYLIKQHLYCTRLRAIENRKPIIVNANCGYSGLINAKGELNVHMNTKEPHVIVNEITYEESCSYFRYRKIVFLLIISVLLSYIFIKHFF